MTIKELYNKYSLHDIANNYIANGYSVIPINLETKRPLFDWKEYQKRIPTKDESKKMFQGLDWVKHGIAIVCGKVSGNLEVIDIDNKVSNFNEIHERYFKISEVGRILNHYQNVYFGYSRSGGFHILYRCETKIPGSQVLAKFRNSDGNFKTVFETRGEGGYIIAFPTSGYYHKKQGTKIFNLAPISVKDRNSLINYAKAINEDIDIKQFKAPIQEQTTLKRPSDEFNISKEGKETVMNLLQKNGWKHMNGIYWLRPSKDNGVSATFGYVGENILYVFSSNAQPFEANTSYNPFQILALLKYQGNFKAAAAELYRRGFGKKEDNIYSRNMSLYLSDSYIDFESDIKLHPLVLLKQSTGEVPIATSNNFSAITGKNKSGKTLFLTYLLSCFFKPDGFRFDESIMKKKIVFFDTEQSKEYSKEIISRILNHTGLRYKDIKDRIEVLNIRKYKPNERLGIIGEKLTSDYNIGLVAIDGYRDLITDINNLTEVNALLTQILKWNEIFPIHIIGVIHQNKTNLNLRGHLGTEISNKSETIFRISKKGSNISISCDASRNKSFDEFEMKIEDKGILIPLNETNMNNKFKDPKEIPEEKHKDVLRVIYSEESKYSYSELFKQIKLSFDEVHRINFGDNKAKIILRYYLDVGFLRKELNKYVLNIKIEKS